MNGANRRIGIWLVVCAVLIASMVVIGGLTRLTGSGLSITEWDLVMGTIPPLGQAQWEEVFQKYQQSPEYRHVNLGMSLTEFKAIFWWEYVHRLLGRIMGFAFIIPLGVFIARRQLERQDILKLSVLFVLGGLQGLLGWYMVKSGLVKIPQVSHFRLTAHLALAFLLFGFTLRLALQFLDRGTKRPAPARASLGLRAASLVLLGTIFLQVALGAMVAGLKAGYIFNTFPMMGNWWIPPGIWQIPLHNPVFIQFAHRLTAYLLILLIGWIWWRWRREDCDSRQSAGILLVSLAGLGQFILGILTLLLVVPIVLGSLHQLGALVLFGCAIFLCHTMRPVPERDREGGRLVASDHR